MHLNDIFAGLFGIAVLFQQAYQQFGHGRWQQTQQQQIQQTQQQLFQLAYNAPAPWDGRTAAAAHRSRARSGNAMNLRAALKALLSSPADGENPPTADEILAEAHALRIDSQVEQLQRDGLLSADPAAVDYARRSIERDGDEYITHIRAARPAPAAPSQIITPTAPPDATESAINALVEGGMAYHEAAAEVSKGSSLKD